jgi:LuxR family maltose regulon positive regulatory protein
MLLLKISLVCHIYIILITFIAILLDWPATAWYSLEQQNIEPYNFFYDLIQAVKKVFPGFGRDSLRTLKSLENLARDWSIAAKTFLAELPKDRQLILVFDDLHLVYKNEPVVALLDYLLQRLPENLQAVLIARFKPPFKLYPKELEGKLLQIKRQELLFTPEEALDLFSFMGLELADRGAAALHARTEGWAVGLRLLGIYMKQSENHPQNALWLMNQEDSYTCN